MIKMDDSFELEYADELDALGLSVDEPPSYNLPKSKKSLQFSAPDKTRSSQQTVEKENISDEFDSIVASLSSPELEYTENQDGRKRPHLSLSPDDGEHKNSRNRTGKRQRCTEETVEASEYDAAVAYVHSQRAQTLPAATRPQGQDEAEQRVHKHIPKGDFISTLGYEGQRVYMRLWDEDVLESEFSSVDSNARLHLLPTPVSLMREKIEDEHSRKVLQQADELHQNVRRQLDEIERERSEETADVCETDMETMEQVNNEVNILAEEMKSLWVEKYAPQKYTELLSEESINRSLLHWLKLWDFVVFGKDVPKPMKKASDKFKPKKENETQSKFKKLSDVVEDLDNHNRPQQKVALLCGPPGLGKTTLAHIVASHAGYNVVEMNASDDRSVEIFTNKLESSTQMRSVNESDPRPNCLVIDEIDGAPTPAINVLLNLIKTSDTDASSNKKKKKDSQVLMRPIICVCNDQFVPALRQLRQNALILNFPQTESSRLASRLHEVVRLEQLKTDVNALLALCERTDNDIRSCLNTLQFVRQSHKELTLRDVQTMSVGQKDTHKSLFSVWNDVFTMPRPKKNRFVSIHDIAEGKQDTLQMNNISLSSRFQHILFMCQAAGESDRVLQGIFENYLEAKAKDPHLVGLNIANEWLCFSDGLCQYIAKSQDYSVMKFTSFLPVIFHFLYATYNPSRIQFPVSQNEARQKEQKTSNLLNSMLSDMNAMTQKFTNSNNLVLDLLCPLLDILHPTLRPVNTQLYSSREKEELANIVNIMIAYNMTYHQEKTPEGQYVYALDPNVEEVIKFPGLKQRKQLTYGAKQMIAREIALEKMRRAESTRSKSATSSKQPQKADPAQKKSNSAQSLPNHLQKLEAKSIAPEKAPVNFFGNFVRTKREKATTDEAEQIKIQEKNNAGLLDTLIWFHFKEGFSNAVRRNVKVQDLL